MSKKNFVTLILTTIGGIMFGIGMCMCLLPEWNAFNEGIVVGLIGTAVLLAMVLIRRKMEGKSNTIKLNSKTIGAIIIGALGTLAFGVGMCLIMVWNEMLWGIIVGIVGIVLLLCLIPMFMGLKD
ncbi:MAG: hypothetical protein IKL92_00285 [Oscillospiraceae bacterium]|nr:hypothetical protein [Oscillospiraceae bacterium]